MDHKPPKYQYLRMVNLQSPPTIEVGKVSLSDFHAKLYAHELIRRYPSDNIERFTVALLDSKVDLNPHQIDTAEKSCFS